MVSMVNIVPAQHQYSTYVMGLCSHLAALMCCRCTPGAKNRYLPKTLTNSFLNHRVQKWHSTQWLLFSTMNSSPLRSSFLCVINEDPLNMVQYNVVWFSMGHQQIVLQGIVGFQALLNWKGLKWKEKFCWLCSILWKSNQIVII